jgi:hypothetical protein
MVLMLFLGGCGVTPPPEAPSDLALKPMLGATVLRYRVQVDASDSFRDVAIDGGSFAEESGSDVAGSSQATPWRKKGAETVVLEGDAAREERNRSAWLGLEFAHPGPGDRVDVESCARDRCTIIFLPKGGSAIWLDVDRASRRPSAIQWIDAKGEIESCENLRFDRDGSAIASATCTHIVRDVGQQTSTWTLVEKQNLPSMPEWARAPAIFSPAG